MGDDFYIGYREKSPEATARIIRRLVPVLALLLIATAVLLVRAQEFDASSFEFGTEREFEGSFSSFPAPHLTARDGSAILLVGMGKHGVNTGLPDGTPTRLRGTRIRRGNALMVEVRPESVEATGPPAPTPTAVRLESVVLTGEIVGSKCYLGVMNPGRGTVHRACARHCMLGDVPPMLHQADNGNPDGLLLTGLDHQALALLAARPVAIRGTRWRLPGLEWVQVNQANLLAEGGS